MLSSHIINKGCNLHVPGLPQTFLLFKEIELKLLQFCHLGISLQFPALFFLSTTAGGGGAPPNSVLTFGTMFGGGHV